MSDTVQQPKMNRQQRRTQEAQFRTAQRRAKKQVFQKVERKVDELLAAGRSLQEVQDQLNAALVEPVVDSAGS
jgi:hypothetical protein